MSNATEFGKIIRGLLGSDVNSQTRFAKELDVSPAILSYYLTGKTIPKLEFVSKCIKIFKLDKQKSSELYFKYFLSAFDRNKKIPLDVRTINPNRIEVLGKLLTILFLYPETTARSALYSDREPFETLVATIGSFYNKLAGER